MRCLFNGRPGMGLISNLFVQARGAYSPNQQDPPNRFAGTLAYLSRFAILAFAYAVAVRLSLYLEVPPGIITPLWLPSAVALCGCLAWGWGMAPAIWVGTAIGLLSISLMPALLVVMATGAMLEAVMATVLVRRLYLAHNDFIYQQAPSRFIGIALLSSMIGAFAVAAGLAMASQSGAQTLMAGWLIRWLGDAAGMIIGVPLLHAWRINTDMEWTSGKIIEAVLFTVLLPTITQIIFSGILGDMPLAYLTIPFFVWAALRFNLSAVAWTTAIICAISAWNTVHGNGPFAGDDVNTSLVLLMLYVTVISSIGLVLAHQVYRRSGVETMLREERDGREQHVLRRTDVLISDIENRKRIEQQLAEAQHLAQLGSWNWDVDTGKITWSDEMYRIFGVSKETFELSPDNCRKQIYPEDLESVRAAIRECAARGTPFHIELRIELPDGSLRAAAARGHPSTNNNGCITRVFGTVQDITDAKQAEASLREAEERYRKVVELSPDAILVQQDEVFAYVNPAAVALLGACSMDDIVGQSLYHFIHPDYHALSRERLARLQRGETVSSVEKKFRRLDGSEIDVEVNASPFLHQGGFASLYIIRDITERKKTTAQMAYLAHYDSLTGLPNRTLFHQRLEHALTIAQRPGRSLEILFLDLDRFKNINDTLGHATGDIVLQETAARLQSILRESDTVARLGGDEFVVLVENVDEPHRGSTIAEKILAAFVPPFLRDKNPMSISTSIGIASFPTDGRDADTLLKNADIAMYRAKEMGRNSYCYFSPEMNMHAAERLSLENALSHAIEHDELCLYYQPKIDVMTNRITGMEALLRWQHPIMGSVPTHQFIPVAEESGLIKSIGYWAIRTACMQNKHWQQLSPARLKVAVNLSPRQLADSMLLDNIDAILSETQLDAAYLELEISESAIMSAPEKNIALLNALRERGVTVAIDDFGIGYSSLAYLKQFPIRAVKIDRSFVQGVPFSRGDSAITKAIINLAHSLECSVIAEGAETQQQYDFLRENACDSVQGFYFSEPMPAEHFGDLIKVQSNLHLH